jgi:hypothetical protein
LSSAFGTRIEAAVVDIVDADAVRLAFAKIAARLGPVDILINNAGVSRHPSLERTTPGGFRDDVDANLNGAHNCAHAMLPEMKARRPGAIVNIGSVNGLAAFGDAAYGAGKAEADQPDKSDRIGIRPLQHPGEYRLPRYCEHAALERARVPESGDSGPARALVSARPHRRADRGHSRGRLSRL